MILFSPEEWEAIKGCSSGRLEIPDEIFELTPEEEQEMHDFFMAEMFRIFSKPVEED